ALAACAAPPPLPAAREGDGATLSVIDHGWHTDLALPADEAVRQLRVFRAIFPGAKTLVFGFGKRTFMIAPAHSVWDYVIGPIPGDAAVEVSALSTTAAAAYPDLRVATVALPPGGAAAVSDFIWSTIAHDASGRPRLLNAGPWPGSLFYVSATGYSLAYTCNTWTATALERAGLPVEAADIHLAGTLMERLTPTPAAPPAAGALVAR
ncbi:DUF2459 domain-containing protein, partial [Acidisphaera rubrifaciens]|uniref:DUF2459 domain-containing protein n=1 Tax=Acidisphaera rubrifaciens TaxID=50715 RepID=UPI00066299EC